MKKKQVNVKKLKFSTQMVSALTTGLQQIKGGSYGAAAGCGAWSIGVNDACTNKCVIW